MRKAIKKAVQQITAWSFSRFQDYMKCPALAKYKHVDKLKEPSNAAMDNGSRLHKLAENTILGSAKKKLPVELGKFKKQFAVLQKAKALCEQEWAFDKQWQKVGWFDPEAWLRIKMDAHYLVTAKAGKLTTTTVVVVDHKTGKRRDIEHAEQRELYAIGAFLVYPDALKCNVEHWYLDTGDVARDIFDARDLPKLQAKWLGLTRAMLNDKRFAPRPGQQCRWCFFRKSNGGPCKF